MPNKTTRIAFALLASFAIALLGPSCAGSPGPKDLGYAEVAKYEGQDLSSIGDFRENSIKGPQDVDRDSYRLEITGAVDEPLALTYDEVLDRATYKKLVRLDCVEGWSVDILWEGVLARDLLEQAGVQPDAKEVIIRAVDDYSTSFPVEYLTDNDILIAYKMNDVELPPERGFPFQLVAEDKWGYKWIKWIDSVEVVTESGYQGYWESRGYSNTGDRDKPSFGGE